MSFRRNPDDTSFHDVAEFCGVNTRILCNSFYISSFPYSELNRRIQQEVIDQEADKLAEQNAKEKKEKAADRFHDFLMIMVGAAVTFVIDRIEDIVDAIVLFSH